MSDSLRPQIDALRTSALAMARAAGSLLCHGDPLSPEARAILFDPNAPLAVITGDDDIFKEVSPQWEEVLGWTPSEMVGRSWQEFVHPDDLASSIESSRRQSGEGFINRYRTRWDRYVPLRWYGAHWRGHPLAFSVAVPLDNSGERTTLTMWPPLKPPNLP